jgi:hypothetical protein
MIREWDKAFRDFKPEELQCSESGGYKFHPGFAELVQQLRDLYAKPIFVNSCCRSEAYNLRLDRSSKNSLHIYDNPKRGALGTCAMDVRVTDPIDRHELMKIALMLGFSCYFIGGNPVNIHMDQRKLLGEKEMLW